MLRSMLKAKSLLQGSLWVCLLFLFVSPASALDSYNLMQGIGYATVILQDIAIGLGLSLFLGAIYKFKRYGESRTFMSQQNSMARPLAMMISSICLLCIPTITKTLLLTLWGYSSPLAYPNLVNVDADQMIKPVIALIRFVGLIGIVRGFVLMSRVGGEGNQPGMVGKAFMHLLGGVLCIQVISVYHILSWLFSFSG